ncbi:hypothetical protein FRC02_005556 [Tulasnella sp. 418]|nr:hypothetical protein FRC02_005556 [Tulasnella sp. 418]
MLILRDTISAVTYLHSQHIIHGDIKGDNVLVDDLENPRLCDFGLAHFVNEYPLDLEIAALLSSASLGRTLSFSSPELLDTGRSTEMSDVWALGCLGIQVLTNQMPYGWLNNATHIHQNIMLGHPPFDIGAFSPRNDLEHQLLGIISTCWAKNSNNRPSADQLLSRVNSLIKNGLQITTRLPMRESR